MSEERKAVVTLHKGVNADEFLDNMTTTYGSDSIPARSVEIYNEKPGSISNFDFVLTQAEAETLKNDPRVRDVRWGTKIENGMMLTPFVLESSKSYARSSSQTNADYDWGKPECTSTTSRYGAGSSLNYAHTYNLQGTGVDVVIQDSGIEVGHPEWEDASGTTRLKQIDWPSASGLSGIYTQTANQYRDLYGHGTHCAGTTAGKLYGWAKNSDIYSIKILEDPGNTFGVSASFDMIRGWHNAKGNSRPTVVNMSWGYLSYYNNITSINYRGTSYAETSPNTTYGMIQQTFDSGQGAYVYPTRVTSVESDMEDCINDGIILVGAAGNYYHKIDSTTGDDYNNYFVSSLYGNRYYHRGSTPGSTPGAICVGAIDFDYTSGEERATQFTEKGPRIDIYAPGRYIQSAIPVGATLSSGAADHPENASYKIKKISGTSMACPQVAGIIATLLEARPNYTAADCLAWLQDQAANGRLNDPTTGTPSTDYVNYRALQGSPNRYLQTPFVNQYAYQVSGGLSVSS